MRCVKCGTRMKDLKPITNYECYFGTEERAVDSLSLLLEFPDHNRKEVRDWQKEVRKTGTIKWLRQECTNPRWWGQMNEPYNRD